jgi:hypothetical protein
MRASYCLGFGWARNPDGHAWGRCSLKQALHNAENTLKSLNLLQLRPLPGSTKPIPFVLTGDEAFPLSKHMIQPYPRRNLTVEERIANFRISRGRRISENIIGILGNRWRCFRASFLLCPEKVEQITMAVLTLHNWLRSDNASRNIYCPLTLIDSREDMATGKLIPGLWRYDIPLESLLPLQPASIHNSASEAKAMHQELQGYSVMRGMLPGNVKCVAFRTQHFRRHFRNKLLCLEISF